MSVDDCTEVLTSFLSLLYSLLTASLLLITSINDDDSPNFIIAIFILFLTVINGFVHYRVKTDQLRILDTKITSWIKRNGTMKCTRTTEENENEEIPFFELSTDDVVLRDENESLSFILNYVSETNLEQNNKLRIVESVSTFLRRSLINKQTKPYIFGTILNLVEKCDVFLIPITAILAILGLVIAFIFAEPEEDYANERSNIIALSFVCIPLLRSTLPLIATFHILCDNLTVKYMFSPSRSITCSLFSLLDLSSLLIESGWSSWALRLSTVTGISTVDKAGILSSDPLLDKLFFVRSSEGEISAEILHVSSEIVGSAGTTFSFDHLEWHTFIHSICPIVESIRVNDCIEGSNDNCLCAIHKLIPRTSYGETDKTCMYRCKFNHKIEGETDLRAQYGIVREMEMYRLHARGSPSLILPLCSSYWDGREARSMTDKVIALAYDFAWRHSITGHCVAVSCASLLSSQHSLATKSEWITKEVDIRTSKLCSSVSEFDLVSHTSKDEKMSIPQTFLALASSQEQVLPSVFQMIESLQESCIRFILFSKDNQLRSRIIGEKLGLETGWNCHISLLNDNKKEKDNEEMTSLVARPVHVRSVSCPNGKCVQHGLSQPSLPPNMARLPTGVHEIRPHLEEVDNVPLLVSLFTDCTVTSTREMIDILHEYGESELVLGSVLCPDNLLTLMKGVFSIGVHPLVVSACKLPSHIKETEDGIASLGADLIINQSQISSLPRILSFSRQRASLFNHALSFYFVSSVSLSFNYLLTLLLQLPFPRSSIYGMMHCLVLDPLLCLSISLYNDGTTRISLTAPPSPLAQPISIFFFYHFPHLITLSATYVLMLTLSGHLPCLIPLVCQSILPFHANASIHQIECLMSFLKTISLILSSTPHIFPYETSYRRLPFMNPIWSFVVILFISLQYILSHNDLFSPHLALVFYAVLSVASICIAQSYKRANIAMFRKENRRRKFGFDTKLGMNSPY